MPNENDTTITAIVLQELIRDTQWQIDYHLKKLVEAKTLLEIYNNQLNQLN
jgi:hypothetical protein